MCIRDSAKTIKTGNEAFDKRFHLSSDDAQAALRILTPGRMERILALADSSFGKFAVNLDRDGRLYIAVHSGRGFFDIGKARENQAQLRLRFAREPVSYKHLDVYKRQMKECAERSFLAMSAETQQLYWEHFGLWYEQHRQYPVSYTHLDVYKRQGHLRGRPQRCLSQAHRARYRRRRQRDEQRAERRLPLPAHQAPQ